MLPHSQEKLSRNILKWAQSLSSRVAEKQGRYADTATSVLVYKLMEIGSKLTDLEAKVAGGSEMFSVFKDTSHGIGERNIEAVKQTLSELNIPVVSEDLGGNTGRTVRFF